MTSSADNLRPVADVLAALKARCEAVQWRGTPAFGSVRLFDVSSLQEAVTELLASQQRVCFIVPDDEAFENRLQGRKILITRKLPVALLISDRVLGNRQKALYGDADHTPGALTLAHLVLVAITGELLPKPNAVLCLPRLAAILPLSDDANRLPGRSCVELDVDCTGGTLETTLSNGPNL